MKVLIADDEITSRILLQETLEDWGYEVRTANDGLEAWKFVHEENAARLVILDWMMPGMDGPTLCRRMRDSMMSQYVYIVLLTSKNEKKDVILGMDSGADAFLTKPVDFDELRSKLAVGKRILEHQGKFAQDVIRGNTRRLEKTPAAEEECDIPEDCVKWIMDLSRDPSLAFAPRKNFRNKHLPVLGKILLLSRLGEGGMGTVYRGFNPRLKSEVAVKVLSPSHFRDRDDAISRFYREAQIAALVKSDHLVGVLDVDQENGVVFLVMEMVDGVTAVSCLKDSLRNDGGGLPEDMALKLCIAVTKGLVAAHDSGIVHRDVKPDNILIPVENGERLYSAAKLADLGIARSDAGHEERLTQTNVALGTAGFMAPEQIFDAKHAGKPADIFSLGATLYSLLGGHAPFVGTSTFAVFANTINEPHLPISRWRTDLSPATIAIVDTCLRKNPADRYPDAKALLEDLQYSLSTFLAHRLPPSGTEAPPA